MILRQLRRVLVFTLGIFIMSLGVAASVRAALGTAPITSFPTVLSLATPLSVGTYSVLFNVLMLVIVIILQRRKFPPVQLLQLPVAFLFGWFIDLAMSLTWWLEPSNYAVQWVWTIIGVVLIAVGVYIEVQPRLTYIPADGLITVITTMSRAPFGKVKMIFDWTLVSISALLSLVLMGSLQGVREGTVFAAFAVGALVRVIGNLHDRWRLERRQE
ncbi:YczE/YyaS/YitT family protein [Corynebacterium comes]|uniref:YitT family protein n=1 Tax=Corynebacterium comes TaxID=2675218 RepID=A0A6B8VSS7_9CORY|nr:DUF6198 family protein [Corynebacterium comes]QGU04394.1 hypothetical protein CETAM_05620 [Corynebacterium comes]